MIKDIIENILRELQNEKNKDNFYSVLEPFANKLKFSYYIIIFFMIAIILNLMYSNMMLSEIIKYSKITREFIP
jgi:hypothetical protein